MWTVFGWRVDSFWLACEQFLVDVWTVFGKSMNLEFAEIYIAAV